MEYFLRNYAKSEVDIVSKLSRRALAEWDSYRIMSCGKAGWDERAVFSEYRKTLQSTMKKKGLAEPLINKIMERIR
jgi:hypothetical protein